MKQEFSKLIPNATPVEKWIAQGKEWDPQLHVQCSGKKADPKGWKAIIETLQRYGNKAVAFSYAPMLTAGSFDLEVQFNPEEIGDDAVEMWNSYFSDEDGKSSEFED